MRAKILVVDDSADLRALLVCALAPLGEVLEAANGREALRRVKADKPGLMLLDVTMPKMGGLAVLKSARALDAGLPIVMLTGDADLAVARKAIDLGARALIMKPFDVDGMIAKLRGLLRS